MTMLRDSRPAKPVLAVIGNGPVGVHLVNELFRLNFEGRVLLFGDEPHAPYNRVKLSNLLDGSCAWQSIDTEVNLRPDWEAHYHTRIARLDKDCREIIDERGQRYRYDIVVLTTGSRPHIPAIPGTFLPGVFAFRNLDDAQKLLSRQVSSRHTVVVGGGLLGIETARAMAKYGTRVTLIHHSPVLMNRQLDDRASDLLIADLADQGVSVRLSTAVLAIDGARKVETIMIRGEPPIPCDTVIFATGIRPNLEIARDAGIAVGQGIKVDEQLHTNCENVYAAGECAEFNGRIFGLVAPGLEQAGVLARNLTSKNAHSYRETLLSASLKVVDSPVFSTGEVGEDFSQGLYQELVYEDESHYRKIVLSRGRMVGAIALGEWPEQDLIQEAIAQRKYLSPMRRWLFKQRGVAYSEHVDPSRIREQAIICNCRQINAGEIRACIAAGHNSIDTIGTRCGAGTVCGSCQPLLAQFTLQEGVRAATQRGLAVWSLVIAAILGAFLVLPPFAISEVYNPARLDKWWTETGYRQITGFTVLGLMTLGLLVGLRKRLGWFHWLKFDRWRWLHVILSTICLSLLFLHTGLSTSQGLNRWLLLSFLAASAMGIATALLTHLEAANPGIASKTFKRWFTRIHLISFWPVPVLLTLHVITVYWF